jgi:hypothetical protein
MATVRVQLQLLNSWKEIALYLGRGVRTAQRWERYGLPVRRLAPGPRASVIADTGDIDAWISAARVTRNGKARTTPAPALRGELFETIRQSRQLRGEMAALRESTDKSLAELIASVHRLGLNCQSRP